MKIKPTTKSGGVLVELRPQETQIPAQTLSLAPRLKLKKILVPVDFSECSEKALQYAIAFAKQFDAELILVHVVEPYAVSPELPPYDIASIREERAAKLATLVKLILPPVRSKSHLCMGTAYAEIANVAKTMEVDLIIISTHARKGLSRIVLGSTTEKVVRYAPCPVLTVRELEREFIPSAGAVLHSN